MQDTIRALRDHIATTHLDGEADDLDAQTPLLEWGVIDSIGMVELLAFIERELGVAIPFEAVVPERFATIAAIAQLVVERRRAA